MQLSGRTVQGCGLPWKVSAFRRPVAGRMPPVRITNNSKEVFQAMGLDIEEFEEGIEVNNVQVLDPELGRLERQVQRLYFDELLSSEGPDLRETAYWFHTPPGGWNSRPQKLHAAEEAPVTLPEPHHEHFQEEGRTPLDGLQEGQVLVGEVTDMWLYHGAQVDIGAEFDGLVPITSDEWMGPGVREALEPSSKIKVKVHKLQLPGLYRWPVHLELLEPADVAARITQPDTWTSPIDHAYAEERGWDIDELCAATGRTYERAQYFLDPSQEDEAMYLQRKMAEGMPELKIPERHPVEDQVLGSQAHLLATMASEALRGSRGDLP